MSGEEVDSLDENGDSILCSDIRGHAGGFHKRYCDTARRMDSGGSSSGNILLVHP